MKNKLILAGDRSKETAMKSYLGVGIALIILGLIIFIVSVHAVATGSYITSYKSLKYADLLEGTHLLASAIGLIIAVSGIAAPFLGIYQSKKCFIDLYEQHVEGAYLVRQKGSLDTYVPFQLPYDKIEGVSAQKNKVFLQTASGTLVCIAFNASEICAEIRKRCTK